MPLKAGYLLIAGGGAVVIWSGVRGKSVTGVFRSLIGGENPAKMKASNTVGGVTTGTLTTAQQNQAEQIAGAGLPKAPHGSISNAQQAQQFAFSLFPKFGWGADQEQPLIDLWNQESGIPGAGQATWNANAVNPSSGAYGIPQALPSVNGHPFPLGWGGAQLQIIWGLTYIKARYGNPAGAWAHEQADNWY